MSEKEMSNFEDDFARGCLPTGEPLECLYGMGWWSELPEEKPAEPEPEPEPKASGGAGMNRWRAEYAVNGIWRFYRDGMELGLYEKGDVVIDALNNAESRIAELEAEIDIRKDQLREATNILIDKNLQIDSLYEEGYKMQQRIAELEGKIDQLTAHSDIERQDDKSSNDTQTQTIVYGKEDSEVQE